MKAKVGMQELYKKYTKLLQKKADLSATFSVLSWDKHVNIPAQGVRFRTQQMATIASLVHELVTGKEYVETIEQLYHHQEALTAQQAKNVQLSFRDFKRTQKLSSEFVNRRTVAISEAYQAWLKAREENDFKVFKHALSRVVDLRREEVELLGYKQHPYDALLEGYESGLTTQTLDVIFDQVRNELVPFIKNARAESQQVSDKFLFQHFDRASQKLLGEYLLEKMGYDFGAGRLDLSPHPCTSNFSPRDVRITTKIDEYNLPFTICSCMHEGGHAIYDQHISSEYYGLPLGEATSLSIHESQARLWENHIGKSKAFWNAHFHQLKHFFPDHFDDITLHDFYQGLNKIEPGLIRTQSDELHYHMHILIRFEIEKNLMAGSIEVDQLPEIWNTKYRDYLGVEVPDDNNGILQDIHWSNGSFGYFPTYSLGSFYAAQFFHFANKVIPDLQNQIEQGDCSALVSWLNENIYQHGGFYPAEELCQKVTGETLNFSYFMDYAKAKYQRSPVEALLISE